VDHVRDLRGALSISRRWGGVAAMIARHANPQSRDHHPRGDIRHRRTMGPAQGDQRDLVMAIARLAKRRSVVRPVRMWFMT
jgi:hypothetical protein